jgi:hypothetical protein
MTVKGGDKFAARLGSIVAKVKSNAPKLQVGFFAGATEADGTPVAQVAFHNEYGTETTPARPFFRKMIAAESNTWGPVVTEALKSNDMDVDKALDILGEHVAGGLVISINEFGGNNAASTIKRKGFDRPLQDTETMRESVGHKVKNGS